jgi:hypothetical protein
MEEKTISLMILTHKIHKKQLLEGQITTAIPVSRIKLLTIPGAEVWKNGRGDIH